MSKNTCYVTTPIYYVTAKPHLGSLYSTVLADVITRWNILQGKETFFVTGTDEHGQKIAQAAKKAGKEPKPFVDGFIDAYKDTWKQYGIEYNYFIRTTDHDHVLAVQKWIEQLLQTGDIYKSFYQGWYCTPCETFLTETEVSEQDTLRYTHSQPSDLESFQGERVEAKVPLCLSCNRETEQVAEETYFFKLSAYQDKLLKFYKENPSFITPKERTKEVINFVESGLKDLSISRTTVKWGIPFPNDNKHVAYVWADALNNYITAIGWGNPNKEKEFNKWWPANVHVIGKDIVRFHAIYWPAFLMAINLPLPQQLLVHGWITVDKQKMSKSLGNVVDPIQLLKQYGAEPIRYYLLKQMAITHDSNFSIKDLEQHITSDLANDLGNLLNRMVSLATKHNVQKIEHQVVWSHAALEVRDECWNTIEDFEQYMSEHLFHRALARLWKFINVVNAYFHNQEPWKLAKTDKEAFVQVLSATCHSLRTIALLLWPVMPNKMEELLRSIGMQFNLDHNALEELELGNWGKTFMLEKIKALFEKPASFDTNSDGNTQDEQAGNKAAKKLQKESSSVRPEHQSKQSAGDVVSNGKDNCIEFTDFTKVLLAVGTIESCDPIEKSEKLYKLMVDCGTYGKRQILSGIRKHFTQEYLVGKQGIFVLNLKPRKMMGLESQGMMLLAESEDGTLKMATVAGSVPSGTALR